MAKINNITNYPLSGEYNQSKLEKLINDNNSLTDAHIDLNQ